MQNKKIITIQKIQMWGTKFLVFALLISMAFAQNTGLFTAKSAIAANGVPKIINFQGKITKTSDGTNVANGNYDVVFKLYSASSGGTALWTETWNSGTGQVNLTNGVFTAKLGTYSDLSTVDFTSDTLYLGVNFNSDGEMTPRKRLTAAPYALNSNNLVGDGRIGITYTGTTTPAADISFSPSTSTTSPAVNITAGSNVTGPGLRVTQNGTGYAAILTGGNVGIGTITPTSTLFVQGSGAINPFAVASSTGTQLLTVTTAGNVGIGTTAPLSLLDVSGTAQLHGSGSTIGLVVNSAGNVGIGTVTTGALLQLSGDSTLNFTTLGQRSKSMLHLAGVQSVGDRDQITFGFPGTYAAASFGTVLTDSTSYQKHDFVWALRNATTDTAPSETMRLTSAGNLGIGTTTPSARLSVTGTSAIDPFDVSSTSGTSLFHITQAGNLGVGTTTPGRTLTVVGDIRATGVLYDSTNSAGTNGYVLQTTGSAYNWVATSTLGFASSGSFSGTNGYVARWTSSSALGSGTVLDNGTVAGISATSSTVAFNIQGTSALDPLQVGTSTNTSMFIVKGNTGNVGIGTSTPQGGLILVPSSNTSQAFAVYGAGGATYNSSPFFSVDTSGSKISVGRTNISETVLNFVTSASLQQGGTPVLGIVNNQLGTAANIPFGWSATNAGGAQTTFTLDTALSRGGIAKLYVGNGTQGDFTGTLIAGNIGIGTTTPATKLSVVGSTTVDPFDIASTSAVSYLRVTQAGNVGIGTTTPNQLLTVYGNLSVATSSTPALLVNTGTTQIGIGAAAQAGRTVDITAISGQTNSLIARNSNAGSTSLFGYNSASSGSNYGVGGQAVGNTSGTGYGVYGIANSSNSGTNYGVYGESVGAGSGINIGGYFTASGAGTNYGLIVAAGNVGIGTTTPLDKLEITGGNILLQNGQGVNIRRNSSAASIQVLSIPVGTDVTQIKGASASVGQASINFINTGSTNLMTMTGDGNIGIGNNTSPSYILDVNPASGNAGNLFRAATSTGAGLYVTNAGNVGVGTSTPGRTLVVAGDMRATGILYDSNNSAGTSGNFLMSTASGYQWTATSTLFGSNLHTGTGTNGYAARWTGTTALGTGVILDNGTVAGVNATSSSYSFNVQGASGTNPFNISSSTGTSLVMVNQAGNVGIGTTNPAYKFDVRGGNIVQEGSATIGGYLNTNVTNLASTTALNPGLLVYGAGSNVARYGLDVGYNSTTSRYRGRAMIYTGGDFTVSSATLNPTLQSDFTDLFTVRGDSGNVGIGTTAPLSLLDVAGTAQLHGSGTTIGLVVNSSGNVGIGTTTPTQKLEVAGTIRVSNNNGLYGFTAAGASYRLIDIDSSNVINIGANGVINIANGAAGGVGYFAGSKLGVNNSSPQYSLDVKGTGTDNIFNVASSSGTSILAVTSGGNVGIGTTVPGAKMELAGNILMGNANQIKWKNSSNADAGSVLQLYSDNNVYLDSPVSGGSTIFRTNGTAEAMRITNGSNVGIGTTGPLSKLHVNDGTNINLLFGSQGGTPGIKSANDLNTSRQGLVLDSSTLYAQINGTTKLIVDGNGNVGIGTTTPNVKLHIAQTDGTAAIKISNTSGVARLSMWGDTTGGIIQVSDTATNIAINPSGGNVGIGTTSPTEKLTIEGNGARLKLETASGPSSYYQLFETNYDSSNRFNIYDGTTKIFGSKTIVAGGSDTYINQYYGIALSTGAIDPTAASTRLYITQAGNVGINTTVPTSSLYVQGTGVINPFIVASSTGTQMFTVTNTGNVGIGTTTPGRTLVVAGDIRATGILYDSTNAAGTSGNFLMSTATGYAWTATSTLFGSNLHTGSGTNGYAARWTGTAALSTGVILDNGTVAGVNATSSTYSFNIQGAAGVAPLNVSSSSGTSFLTVLGSGNVGISTTTADDKLTIDTGGIRLKNANNQAISFDYSSWTNNAEIWLSNTFQLGIAGHTALNFYTNHLNIGTSTPRMTINQNGNVGVGNANPTYGLDVSVPSGTGYDLFRVASSSGNTGIVVKTTGNVGIGNTGPLYKFDVSGGLRVATSSEQSTTSRGIAFNPGGLTYNDTITNYNTGGNLDIGSVNTGNGTRTVSMVLFNNQTTDNSYIAFNTSAASTTAGTERLRIDKNGNVGIGTTTPAYKLDIYGGSARIDGQQAMYFGSGYNNAPYTANYHIQYVQAADGLNFAETGVADYRMFIKKGGNVGIATSTPGRTFVVAGDIRATGILYDSTNAAGTSGNFLMSTATGYAWTATSTLFGSNLHTGSGTNGYVTRWTGTSALGTGVILDNGTVAGVNATSSTYSFNIQGAAGVAPLNVASSTGTSLLTVLGNGNVGIGTTGPARKVQITESSANVLIGNESGCGVSYGAIGFASTMAGCTTYSIMGEGANTYLNAPTSGNIYLRIGNTNFATLSTSAFNISSTAFQVTGAGPHYFSSGNVGIGTTTPGSLLQVHGGTLQITGSSQVAPASGAGMELFYNGTTAYQFAYDRSNSIYKPYELRASTINLNGNNSGNGIGLYVTNGNNVGIATSTPGRSFVVSGDMRATGILYDSTNAAGTSGNFLMSTATGYAWTATSTLFGSNLHTGSGTNGYVTRWTGTTALGNGVILDNGTVAGVNATSSTIAFNVQGTSSLDPLQVGTSTSTSMLIVKGNTGNVGIGVASPAAKLEISNLTVSEALRTSYSADGRYYHSLVTGYSATQSADYLAFNINNGTVNSQTEVMRLVGTGNVGIGTTNPSTFNLQVAGSIGPQTNNTYDFGSSSLQIKDGYFAGNLTVGNSITRSLTRSISTTVNDVVDIGSFAFTNGGSSLWVSITVPSGGYSVAKQYLIPIQYGQGSNTWQTVLPDHSTGIYSGHDFALEIRINANQAFLRIRTLASAGSAGTAYVVIRQEGVATDSFTASTATTSTSTLASIFSSTALTQYGSNVGIGTSTASYALDIQPSTSNNIALNVRNYVGTNLLTLTGSSPSLVMSTSGYGIFYGSAITGARMGATADANTSIPIVARGTTAQTADILQARTVADAVLFNVTAAGNVGVGTTTPLATLFVAGTTTAGTVNPFAVASSTGTQLLTVTTGGNVGIGTTNPLQSLHVKNSGSGSIAIIENATGYGGLGFDTNGMYMQPTTASKGVFFYPTTGANGYFGIASTGNVGVATTTPGQKFVVVGDMRATGALYDSTNAAGTSGNFLMSTATGYQWTATSTLFGSNLHTGTGTNGYVTRWTGTTALGTGVILDNGTVAGISATSSTIAFNIQGTSSLDPLQVGTSTNTSMFIVKGNTGNVGIGTATVSDKLHVYGGNIIVQRSSNSNASQLQIWNTSNSVWNVGMLASGSDLVFENGAGNTKVTILNTSGNVGIGSATPAQKLDVNGNVNIVGTNFDSNTSTPALDINGSFIRLGDGLGAQTFPNGLGIKFHDGGVAHGSLKYTSGSSRFDLCTSSAVSSLQCDGTPALSVLTSAGTVGIGTTNPNYTLQVGDGSTSGTRTLGVVDNGYGVKLGGGNTEAYIQSIGTTYRLEFKAGNSNDANYLFTSTGNVGISSTSPTAKLTVQAASGSTVDLFNVTSSTYASQFIVKSNGNVGIGTTTPDTRLSIVGSMHVGTSTLDSNIGSNGWLQADYVVTANNKGLLGITSGGSDTTLMRISGTNNSEYYSVADTIFYNSSLEKFRITNGGNVGIGTSAPLSLLDVAGTAQLHGSGTTIGLVVNSGGNVGIGTTTPGRTLSVVGDIRATGILYDSTNSAGTAGMVLQTSGTAYTWVATSTLGISGSLSGGTNGYVARWTSGSTLSSGVVIDNGTVAGISATSSTVAFNIQGTSSLDPLQVGTSTNTGLLVVKGNSGNVGIGTSSPIARLDISGNTAANIQSILARGNDYNFMLITQNGTSTNAVGTEVSRFGLQYNGNGWNSGLRFIRGSNATDGSIAIDTNNTERIRLDSSGNFGIGTSAPLSLLDVAGTAQLHGSGTSVGLVVTSGGNIGIGTATPGNARAQIYGGSGAAATTDAGNTLRLCSTTTACLGIGFDPSSPFGTWFESNGGYPILLNPVSGNTGVGTTNPVGLFDVNAKFTVLAAGNVGVGTTTPGNNLSVVGVANATTGFRVNNGATSGNYLRGDGTNFISSAIQAGDIPTLNQNTTGSAYYVTSRDTRAVNDLPQDYGPLVKFDFKQNSTNGLSDGGTYNGVMTWRSYGSTTDFSGGPALQLGYSTNGNLWTRISTGTGTWASWLQILNGNTGVQLQTSTPGTAQTGHLSISGTGLFGGNVGIGTTTPGRNLTVVGDIRATGILYDSSNTAGTSGNFLMSTATGYAWTATSTLFGGNLHTGTGTNGYVTRWTGTAAQSTGVLLDDGTVAGISATSSTIAFNVQGTSTLDPLRVGTSTNTGMLIVKGNTGYVGIGTSTPGYQLVVNGQTSIPTTGGGVSIVNPVDGSGLILSGVGNGVAAQLRVVANGGAWADSVTTSYFQIKNATNNNVTFMGGTYGADTQINRLQFNSINSTFTDLSFGSTPVPTALLEVVNSSTTKIGLKVKAASSQTADIFQAINNSSAVLVNINSAGNVGIGSSTPNALLAIQGTSGATTDLLNIASSTNVSQFIVKSSGNVGIGTSTPQANLEILAGSFNDLLKLNRTGVGSWSYSIASNNIVGTDLRLVPGNSSASFTIQNSNNTNLFTVRADSGNVGINTTTPTSTFLVQGIAGPSNPFTIASSTGTSLVTVTPVGNVGIGTTTPAARLVVASPSANGSNPVFDVTSSSAASMFRVQADGSIGIGTAAPGAFVDIWRTSTDTANNNTAQRIYYTDSAGGGVGSIINNAEIIQHAVSGTVTGTQGNNALLITQTVSSTVNGTQNLYASYMSTAFSGSTSTSATINQTGLEISTTGDLGTNGTKTKYGAKITVTGTSDNNYGLYISSVTSGTNNWAIYSSATAQSYIAGNVGIGSVTPGEKLSVVSGDNTSTTNIASFYANNLTAGVGLGYAAVRRLSSNADADFYVLAKGAGNLILSGVEGATGNVGIGSSTPNALLAIQGTSGSTNDLFNVTSSTYASQFVVKSSGNVGIGTTTATSALTLGSGKNIRLNNGTLRVNDLTGYIWQLTDALDTTAYNVGSYWDTSNKVLEYRNYYGSINLIPGSAAVAATGLTVTSVGNVGVGTTTPLAKLAVVGTAGNNPVFILASSTGNTLVLVDKAGNVGIGTAAPGAKAHVYEPSSSATLTQFTQNTAYAGLLVDTVYSSGNYTPGLFWQTSNQNSGKPKAGIWTYADGNGSSLFFGTSNSYATGITNNGLVIDPSGNVGIGTTTPGSLMQVAGALRLGVASTTTGTLILHTSSNGYTTTLRASSTGTSNLTFTLPNSNGTSGQVLTSDGAGGLYWSTASGSSQWTTAGSDIYYNTGKVFIGSTTMTSTLSIQAAAGISPLSIASSSGLSYLTITNTGNVGIGTSSPVATFAVNGTSYHTATSTFLGRIVGSGATSSVASAIVTGLNADFLDGYDSSAFGDATLANQKLIMGKTSSLLGLPKFAGDGSDGAGPSSGTLTSAVKQYSSWTTTGAITASEAAPTGLFIAVSGTLTINGTISVNAKGRGQSSGIGLDCYGTASQSATTCSTGAGGGGGGGTNGYGGGQGGYGYNGGGAATTGGNRGAFGFTGGTGGSASAIAQLDSTARKLSRQNTLLGISNFAVPLGAGGGNGGYGGVGMDGWNGGVGGGGGTGGAGGNGGGIIYIEADTVTTSSTTPVITANGANGSNGSTGGNATGCTDDYAYGGSGGSGGGGGGGGFIWIRAKSLSGITSTTVTASGGSGGSGGSSGSGCGIGGGSSYSGVSGGSGAAGFVLIEQVY